MGASASDLLLRRCRKWSDFVEEVKDLPPKAKGDAFERLVQIYLRLDPQYRTQLRHVWLYDDTPQRVRRHLGLPSREKGIDLIAETRDRKYWAVQAKYRAATRRSLTYGKLSTFAASAYAICSNLDFALICTTTERVTGVLSRQPKRFGWRTSEVWQGLGEEFFRQARVHLAKRALPRPKAARPARHQRRAIAAARRHYREHRETRGKLIHPCGTGKTLTSYWIAEALGARTILIAVPSLALIQQTLTVWLRELSARNRGVSWLCVCSDETAGKPDSDALTTHTHDLGAPCCTNPAVIADWLRAHRRGRRIVFTTYHSGKALAAGALRAGVTFDLGIMDEAHKTVGAKSKHFAHLLSDRNLPIRRRLFMTATERRYAGTSDKILSMDDPTVYGETVDLLSFRRAIEERPAILCDYEVLILAVGRREIAELVEEAIYVRPNRGDWGDVDAATLAAVVTLRKAMKKHRIRHAVSFHSSIRRAREFCEHQDAFTAAMPEYETLSTFHVSSKLRTSERARELNDFAENRRGLVTNARCLTEGVDIPDIDCVLFADPRRSAVDIVQATGRALRPPKKKRRPMKKKGYVVIPLLIDEDEDRESGFEQTAFREVLTVLRALAANDERIVEQFRTIGRRRAAKRLVRIEGLEEVLPTDLDLEEFSTAIEVRCWKRLSRLSCRDFEEARAFVRDLGLRSYLEWISWRNTSERPLDIPTNPNIQYEGQGWAGYGDWLGTGNVRRHEPREFRSARHFARSLGLRGESEWRRWSSRGVPGKPRRPKDIPTNPQRTYRDDGWEGWPDWLGTEGPRPGKYRKFRVARPFARSLKLQSGAEWRRWCDGELARKRKRPADIPRAPQVVYKGKGWMGWDDWLGTGKLKRGQRRGFKATRRVARGLGLRGEAEWRRWWKKKPKHAADIPSNPDSFYADEGWVSWGDWLGTGKSKRGERRDFRDALRYVRSLGLRNRAEWWQWSKNRPKGALDIPTNPDRDYARRGWVSWPHWLGTDGRETPNK